MIVMRNIANKDRRGWRLFTVDDLNRLKAEVNKVTKTRQLKVAKISLTILPVLRYI